MFFDSNMTIYVQQTIAVEVMFNFPIHEFAYSTVATAQSLKVIPIKWIGYLSTDVNQFQG
jgi:hypothetical protein